MNDCEIQVDLRGFIKSKINGKFTYIRNST